MADKSALQIILRNLVDNAFKHCGREQITLSLRATAGGDNCLKIEIRDNGNGFKDPAVAFLDGGTLKTDSGFGLLGIRRMITARGGTITAHNIENGAGSVVQFTLPGFVIPPQHNTAPLRVRQ